MTELELKKGNLIGELPHMGKTFKVEFEFLVNKLVSGWTSIIHLTKGGDKGSYGDRIPAVFIRKDKLHICFAINGNPNECRDPTTSIQVGKWYKIDISQAFVGGKVRSDIFKLYLFYSTSSCLVHV